MIKKINNTDIISADLLNTIFERYNTDINSLLSEVNEYSALIDSLSNALYNTILTKTVVSYAGSKNIVKLDPKSINPIFPATKSNNQATLDLTLNLILPGISRINKLNWEDNYEIKIKSSNLLYLTKAKKITYSDPEKIKAHKPFVSDFIFDTNTALNNIEASIIVEFNNTHVPITPNAMMIKFIPFRAMYLYKYTLNNNIDIKLVTTENKYVLYNNILNNISNKILYSTPFLYLFRPQLINNLELEFRSDFITKIGNNHRVTMCIFDIDFFDITFIKESYIGFKLSDYFQQNTKIKSISIETHQDYEFGQSDIQMMLYQNKEKFDTAVATESLIRTNNNKLLLPSGDIRKVDDKKMVLLKLEGNKVYPPIRNIIFELEE